MNAWYEINIETDNPDFITRLRDAVEAATLHVDLEDKVRNLSLDVFPVDGEGRTGDLVWATAYAPTDDGDDDDGGDDDDVTPALAALAELADLGTPAAAERARLIREAVDDGEVSGVSLHGGRTCVYRLDGTDSDGAPWHHCLTHGALATSPNAPCGHDEKSATAEVRGCDLTPGDVLVGDNSGCSLVNEAAPSSSMPGLLCLETEHGPLYLDPDETYLVINDGRQTAKHPATPTEGNL